MPVKRKVVRKKVYRKRAVVSRKKAYKKAAATRVRQVRKRVVYEAPAPMTKPFVEAPLAEGTFSVAFAPTPVKPAIPFTVTPTPVLTTPLIAAPTMTTKLVVPTALRTEIQKVPALVAAPPAMMIPPSKTAQAKMIFTPIPTVSMSTKFVAAPTAMKSGIVKKKLPKAALPAKRIPAMKTAQAKMIYTPAPGTFSLAFAPTPVKPKMAFTVTPTIKSKPVIQVIPVAKKTVPLVMELPISMSFEEYQKNVKNTQDIMLMVHQKLNTIYSKNLWGGRDVYNAAIGYYKFGAFREINNTAHAAITGGTAAQRAITNNVLHYKYGVTFKWSSTEAIVKALNSTNLEPSYALIGAKYFQWEGNLLTFLSFNVLFLNDLILMAPSPFAAPTTLFRGVALSKKPELKRLYQEGAIVEQTMFWSTSSAISVANGFLGKSKCCLLQIHLPAGYPALFIDEYGQSEQEFLLAPFTKTGEIARFAVTSVEKGKQFLVYAESSFPDAHCIGTSKSKEDVAPCMAKHNAKLERKSFKVIHLRPVPPTPFSLTVPTVPMVTKTVVPIVAAPLSIPAKAPMIVQTIAAPITMRPEQYKAQVQAREKAMDEIHEKLKTASIPGSSGVDVYRYVAGKYKGGDYNIFNEEARKAIVGGTPAQHAVTNKVVHYKHGVTFSWAASAQFVDTLYYGDMPKITSMIGAEYFEWEGNQIDRASRLWVPLLNDLILTLPSPFTVPTTVFRGIRLSGNPDLKKLYKVGQVVVQSQFWSTTSSISVANGFLRQSKCCLLQIDLPPGYPAIFLERVGFGIPKPEQEFTLAPFTKTGGVAQFRVTGIEKGKELSIYPGAPDAACVTQADFQQCMTVQQAKIESKVFKVIHLSPVQQYVPALAPTVVTVSVQPPILAKTAVPAQSLPITMRPEAYQPLIAARNTNLRLLHEKLKTVNLPGMDRDIYAEVGISWKFKGYLGINRAARAAITEGTSAQHAITNNVLHYKYGITFSLASNNGFVNAWYNSNASLIQAFLNIKYFEWEGNPITKDACSVAILNDLVLTLPSPFDAPVTVFRGVRITGNPDLKKLYKMGQVVVQSQFWSTSASISAANVFLQSSKCCLLQIELPAGYPAVFVEGFGPKEQEFLLAPFKKTGEVVRFTITAIEKQKSMPIYPMALDAECVAFPNYQQCMTGAKIEQKSFKVIHLRPIL